MKYIKKYESENICKYWLIKPTDDKDYTAVCLNKIGMKSDNYWYEFALRLEEPFYVSYRKIWNGWCISFLYEFSNLEEKGCIFQGEIIPEQHEIDAIKYNI